jgi:hypothetical protein
LARAKASWASQPPSPTAATTAGRGWRARPSAGNPVAAGYPVAAAAAAPTPAAGPSPACRRSVLSQCSRLFWARDACSLPGCSSTTRAKSVCASAQRWRATTNSDVHVTNTPFVVATVSFLPRSLSGYYYAISRDSTPQPTPPFPPKQAEDAALPADSPPPPAASCPGSCAICGGRGGRRPPPGRSRWRRSTRRWRRCAAPASSSRNPPPPAPAPSSGRACPCGHAAPSTSRARPRSPACPAEPSHPPPWPWLRWWLFLLLVNGVRALRPAGTVRKLSRLQRGRRYALGEGLRQGRHTPAEESAGGAADAEEEEAVVPQAPCRSCARAASRLCAASTQTSAPSCVGSASVRVTPEA